MQSRTLTLTLTREGHHPVTLVMPPGAMVHIGQSLLNTGQ